MQERKNATCSGGAFSFASIIRPINILLMAKVVAPLGSFSASGKIGKSLVFFSHLGRNVVRGLVTPATQRQSHRVTVVCSLEQSVVQLVRWFLHLTR